MPASLLTLQELKAHLWNCAQILRGGADDRTDWKGYILRSTRPARGATNAGS